MYKDGTDTLHTLMV